MCHETLRRAPHSLRTWRYHVSARMHTCGYHFTSYTLFHLSPTPLFEPPYLPTLTSICRSLTSSAFILSPLINPAPDPAPWPPRLAENCRYDGRNFITASAPQLRSITVVVLPPLQPCQGRNFIVGYRSDPAPSFAVAGRH